MRLLSVLLVLLALALATAGCGSSSPTSSSAGAAGTTATSTSPTHLATAKFALHAGLAFGAFHRYIYKPLRAGDFKSLLRHKLAVLKATAAAVFVVHELKLASADAKASPLLRKFTPQLNLLTAGFGAALVKLKNGTFNPLEIETANSSIDSIKGAASAAGASITESAPSIP